MSEEKLEEFLRIGNDWEKLARAAKKIVELGLDLYIDDHPVSVRKLREALPDNVKVIQYGGRWIK